MFAIKQILSLLILASLILWASIYSYNLFNFRNQPNLVSEVLIQSKSQIPNKNLSEYLKTDKKPRFKAKINLNPNIWTSEFEIDKGELDGVITGNAVTNSNGQVIGLIGQAKAHTSIVNSLTSLKTNLPVTVGNLENKGLLNGLYGYSAEVNWLRNGENLSDKPIYTTNFSKNTQANLLIGLAQNTQLGKSGSFYRVDVSELASIWQTDGNVLVW